MTTKIKVLYFISIFLCISPCSTFCQVVSDLYLFSLQQTPDGVNHIYGPKFLSNFNKGGYTHQPSFTHNGELLISARKAGEKQFDLWQLSPSEKKIRHLTYTKASEFLPVIDDEGQYLSFIRQEDNMDQVNKNDQQVIRVDLKTQIAETITRDIHDVGSYVWMSTHELGIRRMDNSLTYLETNGNKSKRITTSIGKSVLTDKSGRLIYVHKFDQDYYYLKKYNPSSSQVDIISVTPQKAEEMAIAPDGTFFMSKDHMLYSMKPPQQTSWSEVADLSLYGIKFITGLCVSDDGHQIALVATKEKP